MYALYRETHPPTAVEHCVSCRFLRGSSEEDHNLVTAAASYLRVYRLKKVSTLVCVSTALMHVVRPHALNNSVL